MTIKKEKNVATLVRNNEAYEKVIAKIGDSGWEKNVFKLARAR